MKKYYSNTFSGLKTLASAKTMASLVITHIYSWYVMEISSATVEVLAHCRLPPSLGYYVGRRIGITATLPAVCTGLLHEGIA